MDVAKHCGQCKHWRKQGKNPIDLSAKDVGHCTLNPPQLLAIPMGVGQVDARFVYPTTPENFLACGQYEWRVVG